MTYTNISCGRTTDIFFKTNEINSTINETTDYLSGIIDRPIINYYQFKIPETLIKDGLNAAAKSACPVIRWQHNAHRWRYTNMIPFIINHNFQSAC